MSHPYYLSYGKHVNIVDYAIRHVYGDEYAQSITSKFKRSDFSTEALVADYLRTDVEYVPLQRDSIFEQAIEITKKAFAPPQKYRPVSYPDLRYYPWTTTTSAEAPYSKDPFWVEYVKAKYRIGLIDDQRMVFRNLYNEIFVQNRTLIHRIKDGIYTDLHGNDLRYWNQVHARSYIVKIGDPEKIRNVFGVPKLLLMAECMFFWPLMNHLINTDGTMLWGSETLQGGWYATYNQFTRSMPQFNTILSFDWKQFDKRIQFELIDVVHDIVKSFIEFEDGYIPTQDYPESQTNPERLLNLWNWMTRAVKTTPDVLPNGDMYQRLYSGLTSGFFQTQITGSAGNYLIIVTTVLEMGINVFLALIKVQGDDSLIGLLEYIPPALFPSFMEQFAAIALRRFNMILQIVKSNMSNDLDGLKLLGFENDGGMPFKAEQDLLASLKYPERFSDEPRLMARAVGIAYANCGYHPKVYRVCKDVFEYLESLGFSPNLAGLTDIITSQPDWRSFVIKDGILKFPTYFETMSRMINIPKRTPSRIEKLWPSAQFLSQF